MTTSRFRSAYVLTYAILNLSNAWLWSTFAGASVTSAEYYETKESAVTWFSLVFMALYVPVTIVSSMVLDTHGLRRGLLIGTGLNFLGAWIRYLGCFVGPPAGKYAVAFVGQSIAAVSQPFILNAPPKIANTFYSPTERTLADAVMTLANPIGAALALVVVPIVVNSNPASLPTALLISALVATIPAPLAPFIFREPVGTSPDEAEAGATETNIPFAISLRNLLRNKNYLILMTSFGIAIAVFNTYVSELSFIADEVGYSEDEAGYMGFATILCGILGSVVAALILDKTPNFLKSKFGDNATTPHTMVYKCAYGFALVSLIAFSACMRSGMLGGLLFFAAIFGFGAFAVLPTGLEMGIEITYGEAGEAIGTGGLWSVGQLLGVVTSVVVDGIRNGVGADTVKGREIWLVPGVGVIGLILALHVRPEARRVQAEQSAAALSMADSKETSVEVEDKTTLEHSGQE
ncbi:uncharacterized protein SPPG_04441 [Spizellomyces punctatus DAOM BR117]|uniref:Major facilitator superfamily (MFS) profile domain-containing protein n=1 Tax=Spizellomyces punctatus (strain DAOM BR117) TaxID=645134 RepID=A0A0L0HH42_SPIPD|nr:uncharacterized protein SPPG_04441 [Spizellomyces punctatus DAOM BR117]KND00099.1 hypothetical protein SPPG_04441 [Spizellomyces punctatus DAOM BR117]|eukprot:XP_016608138.1 hypothetical protein SPPG_04441 [Spizellomyces punctatus DAOM BR117]